MASIITSIIIMMVGVCIGIVAGMTSIEIECEYRTQDVKQCIHQANELLEIVSNREYCYPDHQLPPLNWTHGINLNNSYNEGIHQ